MYVYIYNIYIYIYIYIYMYIYIYTILHWFQILLVIKGPYFAVVLKLPAVAIEPSFAI